MFSMHLYIMWSHACPGMCLRSSLRTHSISDAVHDLAHFGYIFQMAKKYGTRLEVWRGKAQQTRYGLTREGLALNPVGKVVSKRKQKRAKTASNLGDHIQPRKRRKPIKWDFHQISLTWLKFDEIRFAEIHIWADVLYVQRAKKTKYTFIKN